MIGFDCLSCELSLNLSTVIQLIEMMRCCDRSMMDTIDFNHVFVQCFNAFV